MESTAAGQSSADRRPMAGIARFSVAVLDCPDPEALADFYGAITGWTAERPWPGDDWVQLNPADGHGAALAFQQVNDYRPPQWPGAEHPQQLHLDFEVPDLDAAEEQVLMLGARKHEVQPGQGFPPGQRWRVYLDPVGHPFCFLHVPNAPG